MTAAAAPQHRAHLAELLACTRLVVFDMDGTLYRQDLVRAHMTLMLATHLLWSARGRRKIRIIRRFRQVREELADREERGLWRSSTPSSPRNSASVSRKCSK